MATLRVNMSAVGNACDQDPTEAGHFPDPGWYLFLNDCHGAPFAKAGKQYGPFPVDHGYAEITDVPPGKYLLFAIVNPAPVGLPIPEGEAVFASNFTTHFAVVEVCCDCDTLCVTLYNSGWHYCITVIILWYRLLALHGQMDQGVADQAIQSLEVARRSTGETMPGDQAMIDQLGKITEQFTQTGDTRPPA